MLKLKKNQMSVTDTNTATNNASPDSINTTLHAPNVSTAQDAADATAEDKTSVI